MIAILMSTYNGAKYIKEQIDSILNQTYSDFVLYIRDDGSTDETLSIINYFVLRYPQKVVHVDINGDNLGCGQSFLWLLQHVTADYYMFSDQDDVWLNNKIDTLINKIKFEESQVDSVLPTVIFSDAIVVDDNLKLIYDSLWKSNNRNPEDAKDIYRLIVYRQPALGCTMIFNNKARQLALQCNQFPNRKGLHDRLIVYLCSELGVVNYVNTPLIKYRQHGNNVSSYMKITINSKKELIMKVFKENRFNVVWSKLKPLQYLPFRLNYAKIIWMYFYKWM